MNGFPRLGLWEFYASCGLPPFCPSALFVAFPSSEFSYTPPRKVEERQQMGREVMVTFWIPQEGLGSTLGDGVSRTTASLEILGYRKVLLVPLVSNGRIQPIASGPIGPTHAVYRPPREDGGHPASSIRYSRRLDWISSC